MKRQKETFTIENISEDLREAQEPIGEGGEDFSQIRKTQVTFKKVFKGFDETEVLQYIEEQEEAYKSACSMYDRTIEDSKSENVLLRRENKALKQNVAELEAQLVELQGAANVEPVAEEAAADESAAADNAENEARIAALEAEIAQYAAAISDAQAKAEALEAENAALKADADGASELASSVGDYEQQLADKDAEIQALKDKIEQASAADDDVQDDVLRSEIDSLTKKIEGLNAEVAEKTAACEKAAADLEAFKREAGDSVIKAEVFSKQAEKLSAELSELRAVNQKQAYDYAEKLSTLEASTSADRARVSQQMKMHTYHLAQIDSLLSQVTEQFAMAKEAVESL